MMSNEAAERLRDAVLDTMLDLADQIRGGIDSEPNLQDNKAAHIALDNLLDAALAYERRAGAASLDVERLARAVVSAVNFDEDSGDGYICRWCGALLPEHYIDCVYPLAARLSEGSSDEG